MQQCIQNIWPSAEPAQARSSFPASPFLLWLNRDLSSTLHWLINCWAPTPPQLARLCPEGPPGDRCHLGSCGVCVNIANSPVPSHSIPLPVTLLRGAWSMRLDLQRNEIRRFVSQSAREEVQSRLSPPISSTWKLERKERPILVFSPPCPPSVTHPYIYSSHCRHQFAVLSASEVFWKRRRIKGVIARRSKPLTRQVPCFPQKSSALNANGSGRDEIPAFRSGSLFWPPQWLAFRALAQPPWCKSPLS